MKRKIRTLIERRNSNDSKKNSEKFMKKKPEHYKILKRQDPIEDCIFYYANGIIQMATFPRSAN